MRRDSEAVDQLQGSLVLIRPGLVRVPVHDRKGLVNCIQELVTWRPRGSPALVSFRPPPARRQQLYVRARSALHPIKVMALSARAPRKILFARVLERSPERIFIELMTSDRKHQASREGSKCPHSSRMNPETSTISQRTSHASTLRGTHLPGFAVDPLSLQPRLCALPRHPNPTTPEGQGSVVRGKHQNLQPCTLNPKP